MGLSAPVLLGLPPPLGSVILIVGTMSYNFSVLSPLVVDEWLGDDPAHSGVREEEAYEQGSPALTEGVDPSLGCEGVPCGGRSER